ncbi:Ankyrin repeat protein 1 [Giardia muris]|uniref:Ankyrin repeat protein 1 n=1 Tax=Giardia muris TaxID=5742 RepID=A0A4Z1SUP8_GIAMU|nr:Ankyrin repeat protein 1 [Giardia muris]|eukprot:TNJ29420.1 Ankyrin repeat protein 1 [Giardia muris]
MTGLIQAVRKGHVNDIRQHFEEAGKRDGNGWTALLISVVENKPEATFLLAPLEQRLTNEASWSALMYAAYWGRLDCAQFLLGEVAMQSTSYLNGFCPGITALMIAVSKGRLELVTLLAPFEQRLVDSQGHTALWYAKALRDKQLIDLLDNEPSTHIDPPTAITPTLILAATIGDTQMAENLISQAGMSDLCGLTALMKAAQYGRHEIAQMLVQKEACSQDYHGRTALMYAAFNGRNDVLRLLVEKEQRMQDVRGRPALFYAIDNYHEDAALLLLNETDLRDDSGCTSFDLGAKRGKWDIAKRLLKKTSRFFEGLSATARRLRCEYCEAALLLEAHRRPVIPGCTLLMAHIILKDKSDFESYLHQIGRQDSAGWTALMFSVYTNQLEYVRFLLPFEAGLQTSRISPFAADISGGASALMVAAFLGDISSATLLAPLEGGLFNNRKETALLLALQEGRVECARLLADEAAVHEGDGRMHIEGIRRLVREQPDSLFKDVSSSCRYPGGGGHAEGTGEAGDAQPAPRPGPPVPDRAVVRAVGGPGARRAGLVGTPLRARSTWGTG